MVSKRNLIWLAVVAASVIVGFALGGWILGVVLGVVALVVSEVVERRRRARLGLSRPTTRT
ncbi:MAG: hypothetical protein AAGD33_11965 [Actinomycetota bacterium]